MRDWLSIQHHTLATAHNMTYLLMISAPSCMSRACGGLASQYERAMAYHQGTNDPAHGRFKLIEISQPSNLAVKTVFPPSLSRVAKTPT